MNNKEGITLIALIITIIIMLILVAVSINIAINTGLFKSAGDATKNWKAAQDLESNIGSEIKIGNNTYENIEEYIKSTKPLPEIKAGEKAKETSKYQTAVIPKGFTVSNIIGEKDVSTGLVIYDIPDETTVDWTKADSVKTTYNQFVWIPVNVNTAIDDETSIGDFYRSEWANNSRNTDLTQSTDYTEPNEANDTISGIAGQIENLTQSIYKYGGFYIGRYETGSETIRESSSGITTLGIKQDMYPYNFVSWGDSMSNVGTAGAVALSNGLYTGKIEYEATSMLCTGAAWDCMLDFIKDAEHDVTDSTKWGNYMDAEFELARGEWSTSRTPSDFNPIEETTSKGLYSVRFLTTGATDRNSSKNIYDVAGNCFEWTTESYSSNARVGRGRKL